MNGKNDFTLDDGRKIRVLLEHEGGFIKDIRFEGPEFIKPEGLVNKLTDSLRWVQLNPVALYTRIRFFQLKNSAEIEGTDSNRLAEAICGCS